MNPQRRQLHGLVRAVRRRIEGSRDPQDFLDREWRDAPDPPIGRCLIRNIRTHPRDGGRCTWCGDPTRGKAYRWHPDCVFAYRCAIGSTQGLGPAVWDAEKRGCATCGSRKQLEVEHRIALGVAARIWTPHVVLRAWSLRNIQLLCHECHRAKTKLDRQEMVRMDRARRAGVEIAAGLVDPPGNPPLPLFGAGV